MTALARLDRIWTAPELALLRTLDSPAAIQGFLDGVPYATDHRYRAPRQVMADRTAHCFDGAVFAALALQRLGLPPLLVDLRAERDDDHVIAVYRVRGAFGAISKSNCAGLRFREPIYRGLRELVMSYFEFYFNTASEKSLRSYSAPFSLAGARASDWTHDPKALAVIARRLDRVRHLALLSRSMVERLARVDPRTYAAGMLGADEAGLYRPD